MRRARTTPRGVRLSFTGQRSCQRIKDCDVGALRRFMHRVERGSWLESMFVPARMLTSAAQYEIRNRIVMTLHQLPPTKEDVRTRREQERMGLLDLVDRALAQEPNARWPDPASMQSALREVRATLVEQQLRAGRVRRRRAIAFGCALVIASVVCVATMRHAEVGRSAQVVLVSTVSQGQSAQAGTSDRVGAPVQKVSNADDEDALLPFERDPSVSERVSAKGPVDGARGARTYRKHRSVAKVAARPVAEEGTAESTSSAAPMDFNASYVALATRTAPTRAQSSVLSDLLDRRK